MTAGRMNISTTKHWCTPQKYVALIKSFFDNNLHLDPCSNEHSTIESRVCYILPENDGLQDSWNFPTIYVNPPYGSDKERKTTIKDWFERCYQAHQNHGSEVLALVPVATNTKHWKQYVFGMTSGIAFLHDTRLKFDLNGMEYQIQRVHLWHVV